jgi:hypothetical protein
MTTSTISCFADAKNTQLTQEQVAIQNCIADPQLGKKLLHIVTTRLGVIPTTGIVADKGIVAGQSVATAMFELLGFYQAHETPVYNDVDIFLPTSRRLDLHDSIFAYGDLAHKYKLCRSDTGKASDKPLPLECEPDLVYSSSSYGGISGRDVFEWSGNPAVQVIHFQANDDHGERRHVQRLINDFDVNCTAIAVSLSSGLVHMHPRFVDFLYHKRLESFNYHTPTKTAGRLLNKAKDLPFASLNVDREMRKLQWMLSALEVMSVPTSMKELASEAYSHTLLGDSGKHYVFGTLFTQHNYEKLVVPNMEVLSQYFTYHNGEASWSDNKHSDYIKTLCRAVTKDIPIYRKDSYVCGLLPKLKDWAMQYEKEHMIDALSLAIEADIGEASNHVVRHLDMVIHSSNRANEYMKHVLTRPLTMLFDDRQHYEFVEQFFNEHSKIKRNTLDILMYSHPDCQIDVYHFVKTLHRHAKRAMWFVGVLETDIDKWGKYFHAYIYGQDLEAVFLQICTAVQREMKSYMPVAQPVIAQFKQTHNVEVFELTDAFTLKQEGNRMRNCIGGYRYRVATGEVHLFKMQFGDTPSKSKDIIFSLGAVDDIIPRDGQNQWRLLECKGFANRAVTGAELEMVEQFKEQLGQHVSSYGMVLSMQREIYIPF